MQQLSRQATGSLLHRLGGLQSSRAVGAVSDRWEGRMRKTTAYALVGAVLVVGLAIGYAGAARFSAGGAGRVRNATLRAGTEAPDFRLVAPQHAAGDRIQRVEKDPPVQRRVPAGRHIGPSLIHQHAARDRPRRFQPSSRCSQAPVSYPGNLYVTLGNSAMQISTRSLEKRRIQSPFSNRLPFIFCQKKREKTGF